MVENIRSDTEEVVESMFDMQVLSEGGQEGGMYSCTMFHILLAMYPRKATDNTVVREGMYMVYLHFSCRSESSKY